MAHDMTSGSLVTLSGVLRALAIGFVVASLTFALAGSAGVDTAQARWLPVVAAAGSGGHGTRSTLDPRVPHLSGSAAPGRTAGLRRLPTTGTAAGLVALFGVGLLLTGAGMWLPVRRLR
jgi:hypothetical protein